MNQPVDPLQPPPSPQPSLCCRDGKRLIPPRTELHRHGAPDRDCYADPCAALWLRLAGGWWGPPGAQSPEQGAIKGPSLLQSVEVNRIDPHKAFFGYVKRSASGTGSPSSPSSSVSYSRMMHMLTCTVHTS